MYVPPQALGCVRGLCCEGNCHIDLTGRATAVHVLNLDCVRKTVRGRGRIADCALLWKEKEIFAVVELKGGETSVTVDIVVQQIQAGIHMMDQLSSDQHVTDFYPILMYRGRNPTRALRRKLVEFRGQKRRIIPLKCGSLLRGIRGL